MLSTVMGAVGRSIEYPPDVPVLFIPISVSAHTLLVYPSLCLCVGAVLVYRIDSVIMGLDKQKPGFVSIAFDDGDTESHDLVGKRFRWK